VGKVMELISVLVCEESQSGSCVLVKGADDTFLNASFEEDLDRQ